MFPADADTVDAYLTDPQGTGLPQIVTPPYCDAGGCEGDYDCAIGEDAFQQVVRPTTVAGQRASALRGTSPRQSTAAQLKNLISKAPTPRIPWPAHPQAGRGSAAQAPSVHPQVGRPEAGGGSAGQPAW